MQVHVHLEHRDLPRRIERKDLLPAMHSFRNSSSQSQISEHDPAMKRHVVGSPAPAEKLGPKIAARLKTLGPILDRLEIARRPLVGRSAPMVADDGDLAEYPDLNLEIDLDEGFVDILKGRYDAGLRIGEFLEKDMIAVKFGADLQSAVVGSPEYFRRFPLPRQPEDLRAHRCIGFRSGGSVYKWEFEEDGKEILFEAGGPLVVNDVKAALQAALDGIGITYMIDQQVHALLAEGRLVRVLKKQSPSFPGFYLYYPTQKHMPAKLRAFVDFFRVGNTKKK